MPKSTGATKHLLPEGTVVQERWLIPYFTLIGKSGKVVKQKRYAVKTKVRWAFGRVDKTMDENGIVWVKEVIDPVSGEVFHPRPMEVIRWPKEIPVSRRNLGLYKGVEMSTARMAYRFPTTETWHPLEGSAPEPQVAKVLFDNPVFVASFDNQGNMLANVFQEPRELVRSGLWRVLAKGNQNIVQPGQEVHFTTRGETLRQALGRIPYQSIGWGSVGRLEAQFIAVDGKPVDMTDHPLVASNFCFTSAMAKGTVPMGPGHDSLAHVRRDLESQLQSCLEIEGVRSSSDATLERLMGEVEEEIMARDLATSREYVRFLESTNQKPTKKSEKAYKQILLKETLKAYKRRKDTLRQAAIEVGMVLKLTHLSVLEDPKHRSTHSIEEELAMFFKRRVHFDGRGIMAKATALNLLRKANEAVNRRRRKNR